MPRPLGRGLKKKLQALAKNYLIIDNANVIERSLTKRIKLFMIRIISSIIKIFLLLIISANCFAQKETFDIVTYTPPKDFKRESKEGVVNYTNVNTLKGSFCVITMYASGASTGDANKDFKKEWKELLVTPYKAEANPTTETQTNADGWKVVVGAAPVKLDGNDVYIMLTVVSGFGKTISIRTSVNDKSFLAQVDALFETMELDKTKTTTVMNTNTTTPQADESKGKFGAMTYDAPIGWSHQQFQDGVVFKPLNLPAEEHLAIQIMQPMDFSGNLEQVLAQSFEEATVMYKGTAMYQADGKYGKKPAQKSFNGWEYIRGKGGIKVQDGTQFGTEYGLEVFVIKVNGRFERVAILESRPACKPLYSRYYTSDRTTYRNSIEGLLFSIQFTDFNSPQMSSGSEIGAGIVGVWEGTIQSADAAGLALDVYSPIFFANGQVYFGNHFPAEGLDGLNSRIPAELNQRNWATYTFNNGNGILKMPFGDIPFRTDGDKLIITKNQRDWPFYKLKSVDGARFNGTYLMNESYGKIPAITFTAEGKFIDNGAVKALCHDYIDCVNPATTPGAGTYEVKNYTLHFNYTDGRKIKIAFQGTQYDIKNQSPETLRMSFKEDPMIRQ